MKKPEQSSKKQFFRKPAVLINIGLLVILWLLFTIISSPSTGGQKSQASGTTSVDSLYTQGASTVISRLTATSFAATARTQLAEHISTKTVSSVPDQGSTFTLSLPIR
jgi:hypothetical protein